jgi:hypothetical protein
MIEFGSVFRSRAAPYHIFVVLSDPSKHGGKFLFVNFTSLNDFKVDDACILNPEDCPDHLTKPSTVAYSKAVEGTVERLELAIENNLFETLQNLPETALQKMVAGGLSSCELSQAKKRLL